MEQGAPLDFAMTVAVPTPLLEDVQVLTAYIQRSALASASQRMFQEQVVPIGPGRIDVDTEIDESGTSMVRVTWRVMAVARSSSAKRPEPKLV